jgi:hypothetical protein
MDHQDTDSKVEDGEHNARRKAAERTTVYEGCWHSSLLSKGGFGEDERYGGGNCLAEGSCEWLRRRTSAQGKQLQVLGLAVHEMSNRSAL